VAPGFYGAAGLGTYFGRWFYWDASAYVGVCGLALAGYGAWRGRSRLRGPALAIVLGLGVVALGRYTPVYRVLFDWFPGADVIRTPAKFLCQASVFVALLAGLGVDRLLEDARQARRVAAVAWGAALILLGLALWLGQADPGGADSPLRAWSALEGAKLHAEAVYARWLPIAMRALWLGAASLAVLGGLLLAVDLAPAGGRTKRGLAIVIALLGMAEMFGFASRNLRSFPPATTLGSPALTAAYRSAGDGRALYAGRALNAALGAGAHDIWGYDPTHLARYSRFVAHTQDRDPRQLDNIVGRPPRTPHPLFALLGTRVVLRGPIDAPRSEEIADALPRAWLVDRYLVRRDPDAILTALDAPDFDPRESVVLEEEPVPKPLPAAPGRREIHVRSDGPDRLIVDAQLESPAILVLSEAYDDGWRARAEPAASGPQHDYRVLPANLALRAIPLAAGHHRLVVEYAPDAFLVGRWVSLASLAALLGAALYVARRGTRAASRE